MGEVFLVERIDKFKTFLIWFQDGPMVSDHKGIIAMKAIRAFNHFFIAFVTEPSLKVSE